MPEVVAEFSVTPMVEGPVTPFIGTALKEIENAGLNYEVGAMGTTIEGDLNQVLDAIKRAHEAVLNRGAERVVTEIRIDEKKGGISMDEETEGFR